MEGAEIMRGDIELVTDILAYEDAMRRREISQMYKEIACLQQKLKYLNTDQNAIERRRPCSRRFGFSARWEEQVDVNSSSSSSDSEDEYDYEDFFIATKDTLCEPTAEELEAVSLVPSLDSIKPHSTGSLIHGLNRDIGIYFCKHCENSWPCSFFRNTQQFGAHCSNCSRQRKVKHPHDLNSEAPKPRSPTPMDLSKGAASPKRSLKNKPSAKREIQKKRKRTKKESPMSLGSSSSSSSARKPKHGCDKERGIYYCKHCESSWPMDYFRNPQQFGAHCSNCSRQRQVRDPRTSGESPKPAKIHRKEMLHHDDSDSQSTDSLMSEGATSEVYSDGAAPLSAINPFVDDLFGDSALFH